MLFESQPAAPTGRDALRRIRATAVFDALLTAGPLARTDLAHRTGYSPSTVTGIVHDLSEAGYLRVVGQQESTGGRRRTLIEFNRSSVTIAVLSVSGARIRCTVVDLDGNIADSVDRDFDPKDPVRSTAEVVLTVRSRAPIPPVQVVLALPGVVASDGSLALAPAFGPVAHLRLADALEAATGLPTVVENDVNLVALGERFAGAGRGTDDLVLIHVAEGIGATVIFRGEVLEGASRSAGEIGFLPQGLEAGPQGERGDFEKQWSALGIQEAAAALGLALSDGQDVIAALCAEETVDGKELLEEVIRAWSFAALVCICVVNPAKVIFSGDAVALGADARLRLSNRIQRSAPSAVEVVFAELGHSAILHGAIAKVLQSPATLFAEALG